MSSYSADVEAQMVRFYRSLNERGRGRYAAVEAAKLGYGGIEFIARLLACDPKTISRGTMGQHADRNVQFGNIDRLKKEHLDTGYSVINIDTKKKELLDSFYRDGVTDAVNPSIVNDHDFPSNSDGKVIPTVSTLYERMKRHCILILAPTPVHSLVKVFKCGGENRDDLTMKMPETC